MTYANDGRFPDDSTVLVRYPLTSQGPRESWPCLPGSILSQCGPDEWHVCVEARGVAVMEDGTRPPEDVPDDELLFPCCFRDSSELRRAPREP